MIFFLLSGCVNRFNISPDKFKSPEATLPSKTGLYLINDKAKNYVIYDPSGKSSVLMGEDLEIAAIMSLRKVFLDGVILLDNKNNIPEDIDIIITIEFGSETGCKYESDQRALCTTELFYKAYDRKWALLLEGKSEGHISQGERLEARQCIRLLAPGLGGLVSLANEIYCATIPKTKKVVEKWHTTVRKSLILALEQINDQIPDPVLKKLDNIEERLLAKLKNNDLDIFVKMQTVEALGKIGVIRAVEPLTIIILDKNSDVRLQAKTAEALGRIGDMRAVGPLITVLNRGKDFGVRIKAAEALGRIGNICAVEPLIAALKQESLNVRTQAAKALGKITGQDFGEDSAKWQEWWDWDKDKLLKPLTDC